MAHPGLCGAKSARAPYVAPTALERRGETEATHQQGHRAIKIEAATCHAPPPTSALWTHLSVSHMYDIWASMWPYVFLRGPTWPYVSQKIIEREGRDKRPTAQDDGYLDRLGCAGDANC